MKLSVASSNAKPTAQRSSAIFWLFGLVICYQAGCQVYMSFVLLLKDPTALDPWCSGTSQGSSQQCVEAQLFQGWQSAAHDDASDLLEPHQKLDALLEAAPVSTTQPLLAAARDQAETSAAAPPTSRPVVVAPVKSASKLQQSADQGSPSATAVPSPSPDDLVAPWAKGLISIQEELSERVHRENAAQAERRSHLAHSTLKEWQNMSALSRDLQALHSRLDTRRSENRSHTEAAKEELTHLTAWAQDVQALQKHLESKFIPHDTSSDTKQPAQLPSNMTAWSQDLSALQKRMEARMEEHNKAHHAIDEMDAHINAHKKAHNAETTKEPASMLDQIAALGREMCSDAMHRGDPKCSQFRGGASVPQSTTAHIERASHLGGGHLSSIDEAEAKLSAGLHEIADKHKAWEKSFVGKIDDTMRELCSDPVHKVQSTCAQFLHDHPMHSATDDAAAKRQAWHQKFATKIANVGHDLCNSPLRRDYAICKKILGTKASGTNSIAEEAAGADMTNHSAHNLNNRIDLHWSAVAEWESRASITSGLRGAVKPPAVAQVIAENDVSRLRVSGRWSGRVPSVACITLVPKGSVAKVWMEYFIDNFRLQNYEGGHELVLVYHHSDQEAAELVQKYADGSYIKAAVARGDEYPSAAAYRFGAWLARSADVVARWDFSAWHHPHRLSMQVRALAFSERPACLLKRWTVLDKTGANTTLQDGDLWDNSLVAEAAWMRKHWYPHMVEERAAFQAHEARDVVRLDAPGLEVFDEACRR